jgi:hypothetical protein
MTVLIVLTLPRFVQAAAVSDLQRGQDRHRASQP